MTNLVRGETHTLTAEFLTTPGGAPVNITGLTITITRLSDGADIVGPTSTGIVQLATGLYSYSWAVPVNIPLGDYLITWDGEYEGADVQALETVGIIAASTFSNLPCDTWPVQWLCTLSPAASAVTGVAVQMATEVLWSLSGRQFGLCTVQLRPCRSECSTWPWDGGLWPAVAAGWTYPMPMKLGSEWLNLTCGYCTSGCSCAEVEEVVLPSNVYDIVEVKVDGEVLASSAYRLDNQRILVRVDGERWPLCNDLRYSDAVTGTWSVTARYGSEVPSIAHLAMGELACEIVKALLNEDCVLPQPIQNIARQGVSITYADAAQLLEGGRIGMRWTDMFLSTFNPSGLTTRGAFYDVDGPRNRFTS